MLDPTGPAPGAVPPHVLSALRGAAPPHALHAPWNRATSAADPDRSGERARADCALAVFDERVAILAEARIRYAADTSDDAARLRDATREAAQALLAAFAGLRDRAELG